MNFQATVAQLEVLSWRDAQLTAISLQLEDAFPSLLDELESQVYRASTINFVRSTINLKSSIEKTIRMWGTKQMEAALSRAQTELESTVLQLPDELRLDGDTWEQVLKALPAFAGVGFLGASIAAVPTVLSLATVGTSVFIFWAAAPIISPLFVIGVMGVFLTALLGSRSLKFAHDRARTKLILRLRREAERQVFGIGQKSGTRCMLSDIQAAVVRAGQNQIQGLP